MSDEARHWAETQFGTADLGDARRTHRLVSIRAAIARAPDESLPRQLGSLANTKAGYRLFDCGAVTRKAVMDPHVAQGHAEAARHPIVLMVHDDTILDFSPHRTLKGASRVGDDCGTGFLAHSCRAMLASGATHTGPRPPEDLGAAAQGRHSSDPRVGGLGRNSRDDRPPSRRHCLCLSRGSRRRHLRASQERAGGRLVQGGGSLTAVRSQPSGPPAPWAHRAS
jgi:hypothetical protein